LRALRLRFRRINPMPSTSTISLLPVRFFFMRNWPSGSLVIRSCKKKPGCRVSNRVRKSALAIFYNLRECKLLIKLNPPQLCSPAGDRTTACNLERHHINSTLLVNSYLVESIAI
jgi:hypothetical protein